MDSELVSGSESKTGRNDHGYSSLPQTYTTYFEQLCPYYINAGMTYDEFWNQDSTMVKAYRKAHDMKMEEQNFQLWLQGRYIYDALCCVAPIFRAFSKAKKPIDYHSQPFELKTEYSEVRRKQKEAKSDNQAKQMMEAFATQFNMKFKKKEG